MQVKDMQAKILPSVQRLRGTASEDRLSKPKILITSRQSHYN